MHDLHIGDVVAHVHHFFVGQAMLLQELVIGPDLHGTAHVDVFHAQPLIAQPYRLGFPSRQDCNAQAHLHGQLYGVAILDIHRAKGFAICRKRDGLGAQHTVDVEDDGAYQG